MPNDRWRTVAGPAERPRGEAPAGSGAATPTSEATQAALATTSSSTAPATGASDSATGERDIDPSNPARTVPKKKANSPFLVHQKWKEEQELRRRRAAERDSSSGTGQSGSRHQPDLDEDRTTDLSGPLKMMVKLVRYMIMATAIVMATGFFVAGDPLWGYRGKYTRLRTYMPVSTWQAHGARGSICRSSSCRCLRSRHHVLSLSAPVPRKDLFASGISHVQWSRSQEAHLCEYARPARSEMTNCKKKAS